MADYLAAPAPPDELAPVLDFGLFYDRVFDWGQDEHVAIIGRTKHGKSNLARHLLRRRSYVGYMAIKARDQTLDDLGGEGFTRFYDWPPKRARWPHRKLTWAEAPKRLIWPDATDRRIARGEQARVFGAALDDMWAAGNACVVWDDFWYIVRILGMELDAKQNLLNARSANSPQMIISQRVGGNRMVELTDQPTWIFWGWENDARNLQLTAPAGDPKREFIRRLDPFQFLAENLTTHQMYRITAPLPGQDG